MRYLKIWLVSVAIAVWGVVSACGGDGGARATGDAGAPTDLDAGPSDATPGDPSDVPDVQDVREDASDGDGLRRTEPQPGVSPEGADVSQVPVAGQARAGVVREGRGGFGGRQAACRPGCFVLVNAEARFCLEGVSTANPFFFDGGRIIDAEPVGLPPIEDGGRDRLDIASVFMDLKTASSETVEVIRDGSDGGVAVVRVTGREEPSMYLAGMLGTALFRPRELSVVTEYRLAPDQAIMEIVTFITYTGQGAATVSPGDIVFWGDTLEPFFPGYGESPPPQLDEARAVGRGVAYGWFNEDSLFLTALVGVDLPAVPMSRASSRLQPGEEVAWRRWLAVAEHAVDLDAPLRAVAPSHPALSDVTETVVTATRGGEPLAGVRVTLQALDGAGEEERLQALGFTDDLGQVPVSVPAGRYAITLTARDHDEEVRSERDVSPGDTIALEVAESGRVLWDIQALQPGDALEPSPAKVRLRRDGDQQLAFVLRGELITPLSPGLWRYEISRGIEYDVVEGEVEVIAGENVEVSATLRRVMTTPGFVSGEFHQHSSPSLDSVEPVINRVLHNIAEGVEFAAASDHDIATDFGPVIAQLGAEDLLASVPGAEISPLWGHFGAYPLRVDADAPSRGALPLSFRRDDGSAQAFANGDELLAALRSQLGARMIQLNHPRSNSPYFDTNSWDRDVPLEERADGFSLDFDVLEVINGDVCDPLQDWYAMLNQGKRLIGVGNSDSHRASNPVGYPRNYIPMASESPADFDADMIVDAVLSGDVVISAMAYLAFDTGDPLDPATVRPGRLVPQSTVTIDARVLTPPWASVDRLQVIRNGVVVETLEIGGSLESLVDYDGSLSFEAPDERDAWFQVIAFHSGDQRATLVYPGQPVFAISNPFYLDANGDGVFNAPGLVPLSPETFYFCQP